MSWPSRVKILFCVQVFFRLCNGILSNEDIFKTMGLEERKSDFGTEDGSIPECEVVEWVRPSRSKRSGSRHIMIPINAFGLVNTTLYVVEDDDLISRRHTGIWAAQHSLIAYQNVSYYPWPYLFDDIGRFEFLQNVEEGSAVTRFWDPHGNEKIVGVIYKNYTVTSVPNESGYPYININRKRVLNKRSVNLMNDQDKKRLFLKICKNAGVPQENLPYTYAKIDGRPDPNSHRPRRRIANFTTVPDVVYPKLLIIPDFVTVKRYPDYQDFMVQLFAQLNFIDMMFRQLRDPKVHLSIAGIIMPLDDKATPYMSKNINADNQTIRDAILFDAKKNFQNELRRFPHYTWDSIYMLTAYPIAYYIGNEGRFLEVDGLSFLAPLCAGAAGISSFANNMKSVYRFAHELGHMLGASHDSANGECKNADKSLMAAIYNHTAKLEWSKCSRLAFQTHFRSAAVNCPYDRLRRISNNLKNMPGAWLTIDGQCDNFFADSTRSCTACINNTMVFV